MPYVRISLRKGKSTDHLRTLSVTLQRALEESFEVPKNDCFQIIHQHEPNELIFDRNYLGGPRSDDYMLIHITAGRPRTARVKQAFYQRLTSLLHDNLKIRTEDVMIVITTTQSEDWSFADGVMFARESDK